MRALAFFFVAAMGVGALAPAVAQTSSSQNPTPLPAPGQVTPAPNATPAAGPTPAPGASSPATPDQGQPDAVENAMAGEEVNLEARPALSLKGDASWDSGFETLVKAFATLEAEAKKAGLAVDGRPSAFFIQTDDTNFKYEALLPLKSAAPAAASFGQGVTAGTTPAGKAMRFPNAGPYDDIDSVYEAISAYLDEKSITARSTGSFMEEYLSDPKDSADPSLRMNVYVFIE
jgi:effector-binding domain-containing protein